jgi:flagellar hook-associated protein 1 FlgK
LGSPGSGTPAGTHTPSSPDYGFSFVETGIPVTGDRFTVIPTKDSAALMQTTLTDGNAIAASSAVGVSPSTSNVSDGKVEIINVIDPVAARAFSSFPANSGLLVDVYEVLLAHSVTAFMMATRFHLRLRRLLSLVQ